MAQHELAAAEPRPSEPGEPMCNHRHWQAVVEAHARPKLTSKPYRQIITALGPYLLAEGIDDALIEANLKLLRRLAAFAEGTDDI